MARTINAIKMTEDERGWTNYLVMGGHAGRGAQTGMKVHLMGMRVMHDTGKALFEACYCSGNGHLHANPIVDTRYDFHRVNCKNCGCGEEVAEKRNAKMVQVTIN